MILFTVVREESTKKKSRNFNTKRIYDNDRIGSHTLIKTDLRSFDSSIIDRLPIPKFGQRDIIYNLAYTNYPPIIKCQRRVEPRKKKWNCVLVRNVRENWCFGNRKIRSCQTSDLLQNSCLFKSIVPKNSHAFKTRKPEKPEREKTVQSLIGFRKLIDSQLRLNIKRFSGPR